MTGTVVSTCEHGNGVRFRKNLSKFLCRISNRKAFEKLRN